MPYNYWVAGFDFYVNRMRFPMKSCCFFWLAAKMSELLFVWAVRTSSSHFMMCLLFLHTLSVWHPTILVHLLWVSFLLIPTKFLMRWFFSNGFFIISLFLLKIPKMLGMFNPFRATSWAFGKPWTLPSLSTGSHGDLYEADPTSCLLSTQVSWILLSW